MICSTVLLYYFLYNVGATCLACQVYQALIQGVGMFFLPHSPRWLIVNGQDEKVLIIFL